jgi:type II secretory pathway pseudopilin PulG
MRNFKENSKKAFSLVELLIWITIVSIIIYIFSSGFNFWITAKNYSEQMAMDTKAISTNVLKPLKGEWSYEDLATTLWFDSSRIDVKKFTVKTDGTAYDQTTRDKLWIYTKQFDNSSSYLRKWSGWFEKPIKIHMSNGGPSLDWIDFNNKKIPQDSITNNTKSILEICVEINPGEVELPSWNKAICNLMDMSAGTKVYEYSVKELPN